MPFLPKSLAQLDEEKKKLQNSTNISGTSNTFDIPGANQSATAPKAEKKSGSWTNLNQYLDANKEQAGAMADKVVGDIESTAMSADQKLNQVKASTPGQVQSLSAQGIKSDYLDKADQLSDDQKSAYNSFKTTGGYSGPSSIYDVNGYGEAENFTKQADQKLKQAQSEGGRQALLKDAYKRPTYTQGQSQLDNLLVQNDSGSKAKFNDVQNKWSNLTSMLDNTTSDVNSRIAANQSTAQANKGLFAGAEDAYTNEFLNPIKQRAADYNKNLDSVQNQYRSDLTDDVLNEQTLKLLGLNDGQRLFGLNLNDYMNYDKTQANVNNAANSQERAKYAALMNLIGKDATDITSDEKILNPASFNKEQFQKDLAGKQNEFDQYAKNNFNASSGRFTQYGDLEGEWTEAIANGTLSDYLAGKDPTFSYRHAMGFPVENDKQVATQIALDNWKKQMQGLLEQQKYNRKVSKG